MCKSSASAAWTFYTSESRSFRLRTQHVTSFLTGLAKEGPYGSSGSNVGKISLCKSSASAAWTFYTSESRSFRLRTQRVTSFLTGLAKEGPYGSSGSKVGKISLCKSSASAAWTFYTSESRSFRLRTQRVTSFLTGLAKEGPYGSSGSNVGKISLCKSSASAAWTFYTSESRSFRLRTQRVTSFLTGLAKEGPYGSSGSKVGKISLCKSSASAAWTFYTSESRSFSTSNATRNFLPYWLG